MTLACRITSWRRCADSASQMAASGSGRRSPASSCAEATGRRADGSLTARRVEDARDSEGREVLAGTVRFPADYVRTEITPGYAGTVHAEQGGTVASGYEYADRSTSREALYTGLTRGAG